MRKSTIGIGIIGAGFGASVHVPALSQVPEVKVAGIFSRHLDRAFRAKELLDLPRAYDSWENVINDPAIDAVTVALPSFLHPEVVLAAISAHKHVLCEKPMGLTVAHAHTMLQAAEKEKVVHMVDFEFRELAALQALKQKISAKELGKIQSINVQWTVATWADRQRQWSWKCDASQGGGVMNALGVHMLDFLEWAVAPVTSIAQAMLRISIADRRDENGKRQNVTAEDTADISLTLQGDIAVSMKLSNVQQNGSGHWIEIMGSEGRGVRIVSDNLEQYGLDYQTFDAVGGEWNRRSETVVQRPIRYPGDARVEAFISVAQRFVNAIREHSTDFHPSFFSGLRAQVLLDAVRRSHETGKAVEIANG